ncbi:hypothetical protein [Anaerosacchariphilus polymeriproducens]|uniref:Uncharacterized protein n=1 Tax=Anaerosacchariphilus polymeriproducens TaxID=1812858 RepID=A0A371AVA7_9FIRM|nr:hypothetical protein [Anaerosacchariphilus polymeriproducens]RDU23410.1 hypothetical protein DWV06_09700 [Anaerosacchariphilus polymeriproducens]
MKNNFERLKQANDEYEMADLVMGYIGNHLHEIKNNDGSINSILFLRWLQSKQNIFGEDIVTYGDVMKDFRERYSNIGLLVDDYRPYYGDYRIQLWLKTGKSIGYDYKTKKTFEITTNQ